MHRKNITTWMFVAWVVLFWNLGDSLHHMPGLGLHDDVAAAGIDEFQSCSCLVHRSADESDVLLL